MNLGSTSGPQATINVTPMIDVLLVLLIIFMATALEAPHGFEAAVPTPDTSPQRVQPDNPVVLEIDSLGGFRLNTQSMPESDLEAKLRDIFAINASRVLFLKASPELEYSHISHAIDLSKAAGGDRVALLKF